MGLVEYATGFLVGALFACALDWWRRRALRARVVELTRKTLLANHDIYAAERERDLAVAERQRLYDLLVAELSRELA